MVPFLALAIAGTDSVEGLWQTIDDETGEPKAVVEIQVHDGRLVGHIIELFPKEGEDPDPACDKCPGERRDQPVLGMRIIDGLTVKEDKWGDGKILDPEKGKLYSCELWREGNVLRVRGSVLIFHRTQTWIRPTLNAVPDAHALMEGESAP
jgi:uncharacterized protein (DUF2147 family)